MKTNLKLFAITLTMLGAFASGSFADSQYLLYKDGETVSGITGSDLQGVSIKNNSSMTNSDFSGATITPPNEKDEANRQKYAISVRQGGSLSDTKFDNAVITCAYENPCYAIWLGDNTKLADKDYANATLTNVSFNGVKIDVANNYPIAAYHSTLTNVSFDNTKINFGTGDNKEMGAFWLSSVKARDMSFRNVSITHNFASNAVFAISGNQNTWTSIKNADFRGMTVNGSLFTKENFAISDDGSRVEICNAIMGNGTIYSAGVYDWDSSKQETELPLNAENKGLILASASDKLTINGGSATLDVNSKVSSGKIVLENGGKLDIADSAKLIIDGALEFIVDSENVDLADIIGFGEDATIVIADTKDQQAALDAFLGMIKYDDNGELKTATVSDLQNLSGNIASVPEPVAYAAIFGALALALAAYKRRK